MIPIYLESGKKRSFASALEWPGWSRSGRDAEAAVETLRAYAPRYAPVAREAGLELPGRLEFEVVEELAGDASTEFGVPGKPAGWDSRPFEPGELDRIVALVEAAWTVFDRVVAGAPDELRKGPRGGGRDRDKIVEHVAGAHEAYGSRLGVKKAGRKELVEALRRVAAEGPSERGWPARYAARRIAWHALDHAWEIEDRST